MVREGAVGWLGVGGQRDAGPMNKRDAGCDFRDGHIV